MQRGDFKIGGRFKCGEHTWLCTDIGTRVIVAICLTFKAEADPSWFDGPPYALAEQVFDEEDQKGCEPT